MNSISHSKEFNFDQKELGILRAFLKQDKYNIIIVGSYALYSIKNPGNNLNLSLKFNDLDIDFYKSLNKEMSKALLKNKNRDEKIAIKINHHFDVITSEIESYDNVKSVDVWLLGSPLSKRSYNKDTYGCALMFYIHKNDSNQPVLVPIDINFENKEFETEINIIKIENKNYNAKTYVYEKILADKYIAFTKHYKYAFKDALKNNANFDVKSGNMYKLWKDAFDIFYITNNYNVSEVKIKKYINMMTYHNIKLNKVNEFVLSVKMRYSNITKNRENFEDISSLILEFGNL